MATITGTITGVTLLRASGSRKTYHVTADFGAYTGSADTAALAAVGATIAAKVRNGKTNTLISAVCVGAGRDTDGQAVHFAGASVQALTVSTDALAGNLATAAGVEVEAATASKGVELAVVVDES